MDPIELARMLGIELPQAPAPVFDPNAAAGKRGIGMDPAELHRVVQTVFGEAGNEPPIGQRAVANVIMNRANQSGQTPTQVVHAPGQFEPWMTNAGRQRMNIDPNSPSYVALERTILPALSGDAPDPTGGATHFYSPGGQAAEGRPPPAWDNGRGQNIGNHRFFNLGYMGPGEGGPPSASPPNVPLAQTPEQGGAVRQGQPSQGQGPWTAFASDPGNRAFLINMGLAMMTGGWGGPMDTMARAIAAGFRAKEATETGGIEDERSAAEEARRAERHEADVDLTGSRSQYYQAGGRRATSPEQLRQNRLMQQFLDRFGGGGQGQPGQPVQPPSREEWEVENRPGGLIPAVFGGPQPYDKAPQLVQQVQNQQTVPSRPLQGPRGYPAMTPEEMIGLQDSQNPADRLRFQNEMQRIQRRSPGVDREWYITPNGRISTRPMEGLEQRGTRRGAGSGGSQHAQNAMAAMQAGLTRLNDVREALNNTTRFGRAWSDRTGIGTFATVKPEMEIIARSIMHGLSGAQVNIPETQSYMNAFIPQPQSFGELWDPGRMTQRLDHAESILRTILQSRGAPMPEEAILGIRNRMREQTGLPPKTMQQHLEDLRMTGREPGPLGQQGVQQLAPPGVTVAPPGEQRPPTLQRQNPPAPGWGPIERIP